MPSLVRPSLYVSDKNITEVSANCMLTVIKFTDVALVPISIFQFQLGTTVLLKKIWTFCILHLYMMQKKTFFHDILWGGMVRLHTLNYTQAAFIFLYFTNIYVNLNFLQAPLF